jgi:hypothetical protein
MKQIDDSATEAPKTDHIAKKIEALHIQVELITATTQGLKDRLNEILSQTSPIGETEMMKETEPPEDWCPMEESLVSLSQKLDAHREALISLFGKIRL